jgi:hypothetical protein
VSTTDPSLRPVVAIDYDGVLRIANGDTVDGAFTAEIVFREDEYPTLYHGDPGFEDGLSISTDWFSGVGAAWVRDLIARDIDVVLATTWQHWANTYFADILGFPELPVAVMGTVGDQPNHCTHAWKSRQLARQFNGRPLLWVDDGDWDRPSERIAEARLPKDRALTLLHRIDWFTGVEDQDVAEMDSWLALASNPEGQAELRARRRREKANLASRIRWHDRQLDKRFAAQRAARAAREAAERSGNVDTSDAPEHPFDAVRRLHLEDNRWGNPVKDTDTEPAS